MNRSPAMTIAHHRLRRDTAEAALLAGIAFALAMGIVLLVSIFAPIEVSGWDMATQLTRWYGGGLGVYLTAVYLPLYIAHGYTRRAFLQQLPVLIGSVSVLMAGLVTLGYGLEHLVYRLGGWDQGLTSDLLFSSATEFALIAVSFGLVVLVYLVGGALAGAAFYRNGALGAALVPLLLLVAAANEVAMRSDVPLPTMVVRLGLPGEGGSVGLASGVGVGSVALMAVALWSVARDLPIRSNAS